MKRRPTVRATRLSSPTNQVDRGGHLAARRSVDYWCADDHHSAATFAVDADAPQEWICTHCGAPATTERGAAGRALAPPVFFRTPYEFLMMRRTAEDGERILDEALEALRSGHARPDSRRR